MSLGLNAIPHNINHAAQTPNALDTIMTVCVHNVHIVATDPPLWRLDRPGPETTSFHQSYMYTSFLMTRANRERLRSQRS